MFDSGLDDLNETENPMLRHVNSRVDEIKEDLSDAMHDQHMMEFIGKYSGINFAPILFELMESDQLSACAYRIKAIRTAKLLAR